MVQPEYGYGELPPLDTTYKGIVVGCDPSLSNFGWVVVDSRTSLDPLDHGTFESTIALEGSRANLIRAEQLYLELFTWVGQRPSDIVVHEMPVGSNQVMRPESALMASFALRRACHERNRHYTMISSNRAKSVVAGYSKANKARVRNCIRERFPHLKDLRLNEHEYDAYAIALTFIHDPANQINNP